MWEGNREMFDTMPLLECVVDNIQLILIDGRVREHPVDFDV